MMDLKSGILATAQSLGMDPVDLATIISYETAGTFDPMKRGPRTQHGQHQGLIQFGEPQAKQYGVDWNNPLASQLGSDGAVARYYRANGWKPGMGMMDAYSIVNAGAPGRYGASDANNGGAPGTVADKVNNQMAAHRAKAAQMMGMQGGAVTPKGNQLSFGAAAPPMGPDAIAAMFGASPDGLSMGQPAPALGDIAQVKNSRQAAQVETEKADQARRQALFSDVGAWFG